MDFQRLQVPRAPKSVAETAKDKESTYWRSYKNPVFIKSYAPVTDISFSLAAPHRYAVTSGTRVQVYSPRTNRVVKTIARFKETARAGTLRQDGKLVLAGDDAGLVQVFDVNSRAILRSIKAHKQPVNCARFSPGAGTQLLSASQDATVKLFDLSTGECTRTFASPHDDYVRSASFVPAAPSLVLSGAYDGRIRLFDSRAQENDGLVWQADHGRPVESVLIAPEGTTAVSAGGPVVRVWDLLAATTGGAGGEDAPLSGEGSAQCIRAMANHQKTISTLAWAHADAPGQAGATEKRLLSGGLDGLVKVYDPQRNWNVRHTMRYGGQVLSLAVSPNSSHLVAGLSDGSLSIRTRPVSSRKSDSAADAPPTYESMLAAMGGTAVSLQGRDADERQVVRYANETALRRTRKKKLQEWDRMLKDFRYGDALDSVLRPATPPPTTFALLQELVHRDGLAIALANRTDITLEPILRFLTRHIMHPRFYALAADVARVLIDIYTPVLGASPTIDEYFVKLRRKVQDELKFQRELTQVRGSLDLVFASSQAARV